MLRHLAVAAVIATLAVFAGTSPPACPDAPTSTDQARTKPPSNRIAQAASPARTPVSARRRPPPSANRRSSSAPMPGRSALPPVCRKARSCRWPTRSPATSTTAQNLRVLPIVTPGGTENIKDLLYLKGVDAAIIEHRHSRALQVGRENRQHRAPHQLHHRPLRVRDPPRGAVGYQDDQRSRRQEGQLWPAGLRRQHYRRDHFPAPRRQGRAGADQQRRRAGAHEDRRARRHRPQRRQAQHPDRPLQERSRGFQILDIPFDKFDEIYVPTDADQRRTIRTS